VLPLKFLHVVQSGQGLLTHMTSGIGVPQQFFNNKSSKFGPKFGVLAQITFGANGNILTKLFYVMCHESGVSI